MKPRTNIHFLDLSIDTVNDSELDSLLCALAGLKAWNLTRGLYNDMPGPIFMELTSCALN